MFAEEEPSSAVTLPKRTSSQNEQLSPALPSANLPNPHGAHSLDPDEAACLPGPHASQLALPSSLDVPGSQGVQSARESWKDSSVPASVRNLPAGHMLQESPLMACHPSLHDVHDVILASLNLPCPHMLQDVESADDSYPGAQSVQIPSKPAAEILHRWQ